MAIKGHLKQNRGVNFENFSLAAHHRGAYGCHYICENSIFTKNGSQQKWLHEALTSEARQAKQTHSQPLMLQYL